MLRVVFVKFSQSVIFFKDINRCHHVKLMSNSGFELEANTVVTQKPGVSLWNESWLQSSRRGQCTKTLREAVFTKGLFTLFVWKLLRKVRLIHSWMLVMKKGQWISDSYRDPGSVLLVARSSHDKAAFRCVNTHRSAYRRVVREGPAQDQKVSSVKSSESLFRHQMFHTCSFNM